MKEPKILWLNKSNNEKYNLLNIDEFNNLTIKRKIILNLHIFKTYLNIKINYSTKKLIFHFLIIFLIFSVFHERKKAFNNKNGYFACFIGIAKQENRYARELIKYYTKLGVEKFIFGDNNLPRTERLSYVLSDYINNGTVEIIELFGSSTGQSELYEVVYEKYKTKCKWFLLFDFDEYLELHLKNNKNVALKDFLSNKIFNKCEAILFNWLTYTDNNLVYYDNRPIIERFTKPKYRHGGNVYVKSIVRGNLNKIIFLPKKSNHVPKKSVIRCNSKGKIINNYNPFGITPPIYNFGYLKHFPTKTAEEFCNKLIRGQPRNLGYNINEKVESFFKLNEFSEEKLKVFEKRFKRKFIAVENYFKKKKNVKK